MSDVALSLSFLLSTCPETELPGGGGEHNKLLFNRTFYFEVIVDSHAAIRNSEKPQLRFYRVFLLGNTR